MNDVVLHRRFLEIGCEDALNLIMQKHKKMLHAKVFSILKDDQDAEEVTNETFLKAFNNRETIKDPNKLIGWLYRTAENTAIDRMRTKQREGKRVPEIVSYDHEDGGSMTAASMLAERQAQQTETIRYQLTSLLRLLSETDRAVVDYKMDGLRPKQIAEKTGSTPEAVQKRWERLLEWLPPVANQLDELLNDLPPQDQKIMERYLDDQPIEEISRSLCISTTDAETSVKRVIREWKKTAKSNAISN